MAMGIKELFGAGVVRFEVGVGEWPGWRDTAFVVDDAEVFRAQAEEGSAINLRLAADEVGLLGVEGFVVLVEPDIFSVVVVVEEDGGSVPVSFFLREKRASLKNENALACLREMKGEGPAARSSSDDDYVVGVGHDACS